MRTLHKHGILGILFFRIPTVHGLQRDSILENSTAKMPWFVNISLNLKMYLYSLKICLIINLDDGKLAKTVNNVRTPPFSSGIWKRCCPRASKTALGLRPYAVLEALVRHLFHYTMVLTVLFLARVRHYFQDTLTNHVIMGVLFSIILPVRNEQG